MKILWLTNKVIPEVRKEIYHNNTFFNEGWISSVFEQIKSDTNFEIVLVCCGAEIELSGTSHHFKWYTIKESRKEENNYSIYQKRKFDVILLKEKPDIIHIWGTEYPHCLEMIHSANDSHLLDRIVIYLQGLLFFCSHPYYYFNIIDSKTIRNKTLFDILSFSTFKQTQKKLLNRSKYEIESLQSVKYVIGRTLWDYHSSKSVNNNLTYFKCNESLRSCFYMSRKWDVNSIIKHSIFIPQSTYPLKGGHFLLKALPFILDKFKDVQLFIGGFDPTLTHTNSFNKIKISGYGVYLLKIIKKFNLKNRITFLGPLSAEKMNEMYLKSNVTVICSSIENSPNSLIESLFLGCPSLSSKTGGIPSFVKDGFNGFLFDPFNTNDFINKLSLLFENDELAVNISKNSIISSSPFVNKKANGNQLISIYKKIYGTNLK